MDQAEITMIENLQKNTGKNLDEWKKIALASGFQKHGEILSLEIQRMPKAAGATFFHPKERTLPFRRNTQHPRHEHLTRLVGRRPRAYTTVLQRNATTPGRCPLLLRAMGE